MNQILNRIGDRVTEDKGLKEINLELVSQGQIFDSFRRRFDYFTLLDKLKRERSTDFDNSIDRLPSVWKRDNDQNCNVALFLEASRGLSSDEANVAAQSLNTKTYSRIVSNRHNNNDEVL